MVSILCIGIRLVVDDDILLMTFIITTHTCYSYNQTYTSCRSWPGGKKGDDDDVVDVMVVMMLFIVMMFPVVCWLVTLRKAGRRRDKAGGGKGRREVMPACCAATLMDVYRGVINITIFRCYFGDFILCTCMQAEMMATLCFCYLF